MSHREIKITIDDVRRTVTIMQGNTGAITFPFRKLIFDYPVDDITRDQLVFEVDDGRK